MVPASLTPHRSLAITGTMFIEDARLACLEAAKSLHTLTTGHLKRCRP